MMLSATSAKKSIDDLERLVCSTAVRYIIWHWTSSIHFEGVPAFAHDSLKLSLHPFSIMGYTVLEEGHPPRSSASKDESSKSAPPPYTETSLQTEEPDMAFAKHSVLAHSTEQDTSKHGSQGPTESEEAKRDKKGKVTGRKRYVTKTHG